MNGQRADAGPVESLGGSGSRTTGADPSLGEALDALDDGCRLLVTGDVPTDAHRVAAARYFGDPSYPRRRVLGLTHDAPRPDAWFPGGVTAAEDGAAVVRMDDPLRDPAAASGSPAGDRGVPPDGDGTFRSRFLDAIATVADAEDGDAVGENGSEERGRDDGMRLRVCLFRVDGIRAALGEAAAGALLRDVTSAVGKRDGMAQFHLPRRSAADGEGDVRSDPVVDAVVTQLADRLDVVVELRLRDRAVVPDERWHIDGWGSTGWHPLG
ncbi:DUF7504 family protein [Halorarum halobium]|uniref:DUF7504 family protein n=1 Tax=Halorarum halobium TaxID=3075121 RepID=UPI0028A6C533|nr:hypothetical protein [Halobaculum sp. XH14]